jgi:hypothetical protein
VNSSGGTLMNRTSRPIAPEIAWATSWCEIASGPVIAEADRAPVVAVGDPDRGASEADLSPFVHVGEHPCASRLGPSVAGRSASFAGAER